MFKNKLYNIFENIQNLKSREEVLTESINKKLAESYRQYTKRLEDETRYLKSRDTLKLLRGLNRFQEKKEKSNE